MSHPLRIHEADGNPWHGEGMSTIRTRCGSVLDLRKTTREQDRVTCKTCRRLARIRRATNLVDHLTKHGTDANFRY